LFFILALQLNLSPQRSVTANPQPSLVDLGSYSEFMARQTLKNMKKNAVWDVVKAYWAVHLKSTCVDVLQETKIFHLLRHKRLPCSFARRTFFPIAHARHGAH